MVNESRPDDRDEILRSVSDLIEKARLLLSDIHDDQEDVDRTAGAPTIPKPPLGPGGLPAVAPPADPSADTGVGDKVWRPLDVLRGEWGETIVRGSDPAYAEETIEVCRFRLTKRQYQVIRMKLVEGKTLEQIATELSKKKSTVCEHIKKAKVKIEALLKEMRAEKLQAKLKFQAEHPEFGE